MTNQSNFRRGRLIVFEGIDGSGKTTQIELLEQTLLKKGRRVFRTAEPTDSDSGKMLREVLSGSVKRTPEELAVLFTLDRISHNIRPGNGIAEMLSEGIDVICDRYYYSTIAYQGNETDPDWVTQMNLGCPAIAKPDLCIFLDLTAEESMKRIESGRTKREIYETRERLEQIRRAFFNAFDNLPGENIRIVNANRPIPEIAGEIAALADTIASSDTKNTGIE